MRVRRRVHPASALLCALLGACALPAGYATGDGDGPPPAPVGEEALPPGGLGTLRQDEVSVTLRSGPLRILLTPLDEWVIRATAPDTYARLSALARRHRSSEDEQLFLVSLFSDEDGVRFVPEEIQLISRGLRRRPRRIEGITPGWGERRLRQRATEMAVYTFDGPVDLDSGDLRLAYGLHETAAWSRILPRVQEELARIRARGLQSERSSPYFAILR